MATFLVVVGAFLFMRAHLLGVRPTSDPAGCAGSPTQRGCGATPDAPTEASAPTATSSAPVLRATQACRDVGYLCAALDTATSIVIRRWKGFHGTMVVHVPPPTFEDPATARALQDAAADGILMWNGHPFPIAVDRTGLRPARMEVRWRRALGSSRLGLAHTLWSRRTGLMVRSIELTTRSPFETSRVLDPLQVTLTAAHEMGHALGLPHSDRRRDVMYPTNTSRALTPRDYRTVEALYALPDGMRIVR